MNFLSISLLSLTRLGFASRTGEYPYDGNTNLLSVIFARLACIPSHPKNIHVADYNDDNSD